MARGTIAKNEVIKKIQQAFGDTFVGEVGGKLYVWANDGGEKVQIALALTCPKTFVETANKPAAAPVSRGFDFSDTPGVSFEEAPKETGLTADERATVETLMRELGLR